MSQVQIRFLKGLQRIAPATMTRWVKLSRKYRGQTLLHGYYPVLDQPSLTIPFILKHGFGPSLVEPDRGRIYLANSSAYCALRAPTAPVLICGIDPDERFIQRYRAEISDRLDDSEYLVTDPSLIHPLHLVRFQMSVPDRLSVYADYDCPVCQSNSPQRAALTCQCQQYPTILPQDLLRVD